MSAKVRSITKQLNATREKVLREIGFNAMGGKYAAGLSAEGYAGGYLQALNDVELALGGTDPGGRYWTIPTRFVYKKAKP